MAATAPFVWGSSGERLTPEQVEQKRKIAAALGKQGMDYSPVQHWTQGAARVAQALLGGWEERQANDAEKANTAESSSILTQLLGGINGGAAAPVAATAAAPSMAGGGAARTMAMPNVSPEIKDGIVQTAAAIGADPIDLATAISYETGGTFNPTQAGPRTKWGQHRGLIQFGEPQAKQHGVDWSNPVGSQLGPNGAVASYMKASGYKPGMNFLDLYSTINAGAPGLHNRSDTAAGGAPGTVRDKVEQQMQGHRAKAQALFRSAQADMPAEGAIPAEIAAGQTGFAVPQAAPAAMTGQTFDAITSGAQPLDPVFQSEGASQPWMGTALAPQAPMVAQAPLPPPRPAGLALANPQADMPAPGAVQAMGQMPQALPDLSNSPDGGMRQIQLAEEQARQGQQTAPQRVAQALGGQGQLATVAAPTASPAVQQVAAAVTQNPSDPIVQALTNPAASEGTKKIAMALMLKKIEGNDTRGVVMGERLIDPKTGRVIADYSNPNGASTEYGLAPIYGTDKDGNPAVIQLGKRGDAKQSALPQGFKIARDPIKVDGPTGTTLLDPQTRQQTGFIPKDIAGAEGQKVEGKAAAEAKLDMPGAIAKAEQTLSTIDSIRNHPGRKEWGAQGWSAGLPIIGEGLAGSKGRDFVGLVEQMKGKAFLEAFGELKGGGAISEGEGAKATAAIARLDRAQSKDGFDQALKDIEDVVKAGIERARRKAGASGAAPSQTPSAPGGWNEVAPNVRIREKR